MSKIITRFASSEKRLQWAREKLNELELSIKGCQERAIQAHVAKPDIERQTVLGNFLFDAQESSRRLISEYALHARSALDYIIFTLAKMNTGNEQNGTQFPINRCSKKFPKNADGTGKKGKALEHLEPKQIAIVESFQPYKGFPLLDLLNRLSNRDKHRYFTRIMAEGSIETIVKPQAEISPIADLSQVNVEFKRSFKILLEDGGPALETLNVLQTQLSQIVDTFDALFDIPMPF